jgi:hypothetical protein
VRVVLAQYDLHGFFDVRFLEPDPYQVALSANDGNGPGVWHESSAKYILPKAENCISFRIFYARQGTVRKIDNVLLALG